MRLAFPGSSMVGVITCFIVSFSGLGFVLTRFGDLSGAMRILVAPAQSQTESGVYCGRLEMAEVLHTAEGGELANQSKRRHADHDRRMSRIFSNTQQSH